MDVLQYIPILNAFNPRHVLGTIFLLVPIVIYSPEIYRWIAKRPASDEKWWIVLGNRLEKALTPRNDTIWWTILAPIQLLFTVILVGGPFLLVFYGLIVLVTWLIFG